MSKQRILITGAASGLGKALALHYANDGAAVFLVDKNLAEVEALASTLSQQGADAFAWGCDITQQTEIDALRKAVDQQWSSVDVLINNAGVATAGALEFEDLELWQWVFDINLFGMVRVTRTFIDKMSNQSQLINIASQAGITPIPLMASYNASKAAVVSFSETLHLELAHRGIHVSVACPSFFATNLDKSLRTNQPGIGKLVSKLLTKSDLSASEVAKIIAQQSAARQFMIVTHKAGKIVYAMKRFLPNKRYLNKVKTKTKGFMQQFGRQHD